MLSTSKIAPCLWFDSQAEEAARHDTGIFKNSRIVKTSRYGKAGFEHHHKPEGSVLTVLFELEGQSTSRACSARRRGSATLALYA